MAGRTRTVDSSADTKQINERLTAIIRVKAKFIDEISEMSADDWYILCHRNPTFFKDLIAEIATELALRDIGFDSDLRLVNKGIPGEE